MTVTTTLAALKTLVAGVSPSSGAAKKTYAIPADVNSSVVSGGLSYDAFPIGIVAQRLGNDAGTNRTQIIASNCYTHTYHAEIMIALVDTKTINEEIGKGKHPTAVIMAPYEAKAQLWLPALHTALAADQTLSGTVIIGVPGGTVIEDYRIGYLPWDNPGLFGLWCSLQIEEEL